MSKKIISIHAPREGGDRIQRRPSADQPISIHAPREGGDAAAVVRWVDGCGNFNPRPPRGGRPHPQGRTVRRVGISIHAPREGGDAGRRGCPSALSNFNPRPPRGGRPHPQGRTVRRVGISIHAPREGGDRTFSTCWEISGISIHAPREGGDQRCVSEFDWQTISIHAPREGGDRRESGGRHHCQHFNPRPPRGGRLCRWDGEAFRFGFQSTPPARGATAGVHVGDPADGISIHAPREGGD